MCLNTNEITLASLKVVANLMPGESIHSVSLRTKLTYSHTSNVIKKLIENGIVVKDKGLRKRASELSFTEKGERIRTAAIILLTEYSKK